MLCRFFFCKKDRGHPFSLYAKFNGKIIDLRELSLNISIIIRILYMKIIKYK